MRHSKQIHLWLLLLATAIIVSTSSASAAEGRRSVPTINAERAREAAREQVYWKERVCPLSTLAIDFLQSVYGDRTYKGLSAVQVVYGWRLRPDAWKEEPMIQIRDSDLRRQLNIEGEYAKFSELFDDTLGYRLTQLGADLPERMRQMVRESQAAVELDEKVGLIIMLTEGRLVQPVPKDKEPLSPWRVEAEVLYNELPGWLFPVVAVLLLILIISVARRTIVKRNTTF